MIEIFHGELSLPQQFAHLGAKKLFSKTFSFLSVNIFVPFLWLQLSLLPLSRNLGEFFS
jgi:hypothetical protein